MKVHAAAAIFPAMTGAEFAGLVEDIREHGQQSPIVTYQGAILDGRHRLKACEMLGIEPVMTEWPGEGSPLRYVVSVNLHRRHLSESQRALIGAKMVNLKAGQRLDRAEKKMEVSINGGLGAAAEAPIGAAVAAELVGVSANSVQNARKVLEAATPGELAAIEAGTLSVNPLAVEIRRGVTAAERAERQAIPQSAVGANPERIRKTKFDAAMFGQLRDALDLLTGLPLPADIAAIVKQYDRAGRVADKIAPALNWLKEFDNEFRRGVEAAPAKARAHGKGTVDPGTRRGITLLRHYFMLEDPGKPKEPAVTFAKTIKAIMAVHRGETIGSLQWRRHGDHPEPFPRLEL